MSALLCTALVASVGFTWVALLRVISRRGPVEQPPPARGVRMLRPVDVPTPAELRNLSFVPEGIEQLIVSPIRHVSESSPVALGWLRSDPVQLNRKLGHLQHALSTLPPDARPMLMIDADVQVDDALVDALLGGINAGAALTWAAPRPETSGLQRGLLVDSIHNFQVLDAMSSGRKPICGKAIALAPRAIEVLRGLPDCLGEDLELSRALHASGLQVTLAGEARMPGDSGGFAQTQARFTRWMQVLRAHRPGLFPTIPLLFACTPWVLIAAAADQSSPVLVGVATLVLLRTVLASVLARRWWPSLGWLSAEALLLSCWVGAWLRGPRVTWRGRNFEVGVHGLLGPTRSTGAAR